MCSSSSERRPSTACGANGSGAPQRNVGRGRQTGLGRLPNRGAVPGRDGGIGPSAPVTLRDLSFARPSSEQSTLRWCEKGRHPVEDFSTLPPLISVDQAAHLAQVSRSVAYAWAYTGQLAGCVRIGG